MSIHKPYIPLDFSGRYLWCDNLRQKLSSMKEKYGISMSDWERLDSGTTALGNANQLIDRVNAFGEAWTKFRKDLWQSPEAIDMAPPFDESFAAQRPPARTDFEDFLRRLVRNIQSHPDYNETDGRALGFIGPEVSVDIANARPAPRLQLTAGRVHITYEKHRTFSGVRCWVDRGGGQELLGNFHRAAFEDPTPLPAEPTRWVYQFQYVIGDDSVGLLSDLHPIIVSSTVTK